jgi:hypothetical protein
MVEKPLPAFALIAAAPLPEEGILAAPDFYCNLLKLTAHCKLLTSQSCTVSRYQLNFSCTGFLLQFAKANRPLQTAYFPILYSFPLSVKF